MKTFKVFTIEISEEQKHLLERGLETLRVLKIQLAYPQAEIEEVTDLLAMLKDSKPDIVNSFVS